MALIAELLTAARQQLAEHSDSAALDAELLLCHCLGQSRTYLRTWSDKSVEPQIEERFNDLLARRVDGEPVAYLIGERGFWTLDLEVSTATLIPRPETELLVEKTLQLIESAQASVLDLGTGTGAIALALAAERPTWRVKACDVQPEAVALAERNRKRLGLDNAEVFESSWFDAVAPESFDAIVSNPPYIDGDDPHLAQGDVRFEPRSALVAEQEGMADIEHIAREAVNYLKSGGCLLLEHGFEQGVKVADCLERNGFSHVETLKDLAGLDRVTLGFRS